MLTEKQMFPSREKAKASIMAGLVYVDGQIADKPGMPVSNDAGITIKEMLCPYVSERRPEA
ncbi:MAG: S4 domain-containing protein [Anaerovoracaceae bacterium]